MDAKTKMPAEVYGLVWTSDYTGDVPGDEVVAAALTPDEIEADPRCRKSTGDGIHMRTNGSYRPRRFPRPKSVATLERKFGDRVAFGLCSNGYDVGCWIDGKPHRLDHDRGEWTWTREEADYLYAWAMADGQVDPADDLM